jgi:hypothetical protein
MTGFKAGQGLKQGSDLLENLSHDLFPVFYFSSTLLSEIRTLKMFRVTCLDLQEELSVSLFFRKVAKDGSASLSKKSVFSSRT